jgi:hypothetical protein
MNRRRITPPPLDGQLRLPFCHDLSSLSEHIAYLSGKAVTLTITDNASSMLSAAKKNGQLSVRLHRMFLHAEDDILEAVAGFIAGKKECRTVLRDFIKTNSPRIGRATGTSARLIPYGKIYSLADIFEQVNKGYFEGSITAGITWGRNRPVKRVRRITLGSYCSSSNIIRIHPLLDRRAVPSYFVEFIVYHEMLHADLRAEPGDGRRRLHTKEFRLRERQFAAYEQALAWEKNNL